MTNEIKSYYGGSNEGERLIAEILNKDLEEVNKILRESSNEMNLLIIKIVMVLLHFSLRLKT